MTGIDTVTPLIVFTWATPADNTRTSGTTFTGQLAITELNVWDFDRWRNCTNYNLYDSGLILMYNFDNISSLWENGTTVKDMAYNKENYYSWVVAENSTATVSCAPWETIKSYVSSYGYTCGKTISCGTCTVWSTWCSVAYNNGNCTDPCSCLLKTQVDTILWFGADKLIQWLITIGM